MTVIVTVTETETGTAEMFATMIVTIAGLTETTGSAIATTAGCMNNDACTGMGIVGFIN